MFFYKDDLHTITIEDAISGSVTGVEVAPITNARYNVAKNKVDININFKLN